MKISGMSYKVAKIIEHLVMWNVDELLERRTGGDIGLFMHNNVLNSTKNIQLYLDQCMIDFDVKKNNNLND